MKRHPSLEPFSRDHNDGLILARRLADQGKEALAEFRDAWTVELADHFAEEERLLGPLCSMSQREKLLREHGDIERRGKTAQSDEEAGELGRLLHDHIRWEERELFPALESSTPAATLASLGHAAISLEKRRSKTDARRAELVSRRRATTDSLADLSFLAEVAALFGPQWGIETEDLNATLLSWTQGQGIQEHVNDEVDVLVLVVSGEMLVSVGEAEFLLRASQMTWIPKGTPRAMMAKTARAAHLNIHKRRKKLMPGSL